MSTREINPDYRYRVEVCFLPDQYPLYAQDMDIVVVIDVLRATSAMVTAFAHGVERIIPVSTVEEARQYLGRDGHIVAAERNGEVVEGFSYGNSPLAFRGPEVAGKTLVMTTTNGTRTIALAQGAKRMVIGAFLNLTALSDWLVRQDGNVLLLCAGWKGKFNLEDSTFAGAVMDRLLESGRFGLEEDSSIAAQYLYHAARDNFMSILKAAPRRRRIEQLHMLPDVKFCLTADTSTVIPMLKDGVLVPMKHEPVA